MHGVRNRSRVVAGLALALVGVYFADSPAELLHREEARVLILVLAAMLVTALTAVRRIGR